MSQEEDKWKPFCAIDSRAQCGNNISSYFVRCRGHAIGVRVSGTNSRAPRTGRAAAWMLASGGAIKCAHILLERKYENATKALTQPIDFRPFYGNGLPQVLLLETAATELSHIKQSVMVVMLLSVWTAQLPIAIPERTRKSQ